MTYKQANTIKAQVRKGEKGYQIQYWQFSEEKKIVNEQGEPKKLKLSSKGLDYFVRQFLMLSR